MHLLFKFVAAAVLAVTSAQSLPSCEDESNSNCMADDSDLSKDGIEKCLRGLATRSDGCNAYLKLVGACTSDLSAGGPCAGALDDGEAMPCLILRTKPADLSAECAAALPVKKEATGLAKYWADGKRELTEGEQSELGDEVRTPCFDVWGQELAGQRACGRGRPIGRIWSE